MLFHDDCIVTQRLQMKSTFHCSCFLHCLMFRSCCALSQIWPVRLTLQPDPVSFSALMVIKTIGNKVLKELRPRLPPTGHMLKCTMHSLKHETEVKTLNIVYDMCVPCSPVLETFPTYATVPSRLQTFGSVKWTCFPATFKDVRSPVITQVQDL